MSGGFFRGTSADQDTRFSNKTAKLLKTQKFAPELDQLVDMSKVNMDVMRPWIATRVTQMLGFEDEVLINFIYGLLEGKNVDGKQIQIQLTGFMEKNTGKFMRELWGLLLSAQKNASKIPQQFLDEKAEEAIQKKAEEQRVISEVKKKEEERKEAEKGRVKKHDVTSEVSDLQASRRSSSPNGEGSIDDNRVHTGNGKLATKSSPLRDRSRSRVSSKSPSRSPVPTNRRRRASRSPSRSPRRHWSRSPRRRGRTPINVRRRSRSPRSPRRVRSPYLRSPRRRQQSPVYSRSPRGRYSRSPRGRSPRPTRKWQSPLASRNPRDWSPISRSPRRNRLSISPRRRKSPIRSPRRYHRRSPRYSRASPPRHASPPLRRRQAAASPERHPGRSPQRRSPSPQHGSLSPPGRPPSYNARSASPAPSPPMPQSHSPHRVGHQRQMSKSLSPLPKYRLRPSSSDAPVSQERKMAQKPQRQQRVPSYSPPSSASIPSDKRRSHSHSRSRSASVDRDAARNQIGYNAKIENQILTERPRRPQSSSSDSLTMTESREVILPVRPTDDIPSVAANQRNTEKPVQSVSVSSENDGIVKEATAVESDDVEAHGPVNVYDRKAAKKRHREEKKMRKKEKKRRKEEKHRRKEEKRASKVSSKEIASVTPPPDTYKRTKNEDFDSAAENVVEEEQRRIEDELRRKALDSIRAKKEVVSHRI